MAGSIDPKVIQTKSFATRAAAYYVQGLKSFFQDHFPEAKRYLRETLKMANAEDLNRLTSCSLVLLGHLFMSSGELIVFLSRVGVRHSHYNLFCISSKRSQQNCICTFVFFMNPGNTKESLNMVTPAMQLAHKIPDINVQLWATALLRDLYNICGDSQKAQVCKTKYRASCPPPWGIST